MIFLNLDVEKALLSYLGAMALDEKTKKKYLEFYHKFANVHGKLNQQTLDEFIKHNQYPSARAMAKHLIKSIGRWNFPEEIKVGVIGLDVPKQTGKKNKKQQLHLSQKELEYLIEHIKGNSIINERNRLAILTQWWGAFRISELLGISFKDLEVKNYNKDKKFQKIKVRVEVAKFKKERYAYIPTSVYQRIIKYLKERVKIGNFAQKLDLGGNIWGFSNSAYDKLVREKTKTILGRGYNTHSLRHGRANNLIRKGVPIDKVKEIMGHENISSTQVYIHPSQEEIENSLK